ncbi:hypothetical protein [Winogradskyella sp. SYSU M77433]|uniref:hypothetical protein n=1 Tax=Winogradskyella sp. SYSU M77433 TaxID=3042722 RepID=UPI002480B430|nr:hypothetical protein [Winogradskyella sp. SYSU M77433]MDH7911337.1 hypothetical protein [Winogradskyella sp. SYSU M77433]
MSKKDMLLYVIGIGVFFYVSLILSNTQNSLRENITINRKLINEIPQLEQTVIRYDYMSKVLLSNSTRKNIAFLIGTMMSILGTILIISKIESSVNSSVDTFEKAKFQITTTSPGVFVVFLGGIIVITTILKSDKYEFSDSPLTTTEYETKKTSDLNNDLDIDSLKVKDFLKFN